MVGLSSSSYVKQKTSAFPTNGVNGVVIARGIMYDNFFCILNPAANGYALDVRYDVQYNETVSSKHWTQHFPFPVRNETRTPYR
jgi:hypothetical protein